MSRLVDRFLQEKKKKKKLIPNQTTIYDETSHSMITRSILNESKKLISYQNNLIIPDLNGSSPIIFYVH